LPGIRLGNAWQMRLAWHPRTQPQPGGRLVDDRSTAQAWSLSVLYKGCAMHFRTVFRATATALALVGWFPEVALAQSGTWTQNVAGTYNWSTTTNWSGGIVADGANNTAAFAVAGLTGPVSVTLDTNRTIGGLVFDNPTNTFGWSIVGNTLSLSNSGEPTIAVNNANISANLATTLAGPQGFTKTGAGTLVLSGAAAFASGTTVAAGTLLARGQTSAESATGFGPVTVAAGATLRGSGRSPRPRAAASRSPTAVACSWNRPRPRACGW
jgi:autotransporter-associated beta strand protein